MTVNKKGNRLALELAFLFAM